MTEPRTRRPGELVFALVLVVFSVAAFWQSFGISGFSGLSEPGVFPMLASGTMLVGAVFILFDTRSVAPPEETGTSPSRRFLTEIVPLRLVGVVGLILVYVLAMPLLGFLVSSAIFLFAAFWFLWRKGPLVSAGLAAGSLAVIYFVFRKVFQVVLPDGSLLQGLF